MKNKTSFVIAVFLTYIFSFTHTQAASFDCTKANTKIEKLICSNDELSKLDEEMSNLYRTKISQTTNKHNLSQEQRHWLNQVRNICMDIDCLIASYKSRIKELTSSLPDKKDSELAKASSGINIIIGNWEAISRAFQGLNVVITDKSVTLGDSEPVTYSIFKFEQGMGATRYEPWIKGKWQKVVIQLDGSHYRVLAFVIQDDSKCAAGITLYDTIEKYETDKYSGWGAWGKLGC